MYGVVELEECLEEIPAISFWELWENRKARVEKPAPVDIVEAMRAARAAKTEAIISRHKRA